VTATCAHAVLTQPVVVLRARAKYVVVDEGLTLIEAPVPAELPPQLPVNQSTVSPAFTAAEIVEDAPSQIVLGAAVGLVGVLGAVLTVTVVDAHVELQLGGFSQRAK
jgi:hypothetical protein